MGKTLGMVQPGAKLLSLLRSVTLGNKLLASKDNSETETRHAHPEWEKIEGMKGLLVQSKFATNQGKFHSVLRPKNNYLCPVVCLLGLLEWPHFFDPQLEPHLLGPQGQRPCTLEPRR